MKAFNLLLLILFTLIITFLSKYLLLSDDLFYSSYSEQFARSQIELILSQSKEWEWLGYVLIPIICVFKCLLTSLCLSLGIFLITNKFDFRIILEFLFWLSLFFYYLPLSKYFGFSSFKQPIHFRIFNYFIHYRLSIFLSQNYLNPGCCIRCKCLMYLR